MISPADVYLEALENTEEPNEAWDTSLVSMENCVLTWLRKTCSLLGCSSSDKQQEISRFWSNLHAGLLHRKVCYLLS